MSESLQRSEWIVGADVEGRALDLYFTLAPGLAAINPREIRNRILDSIVVDPRRVELIGAFARTIQESSDSKSTKYAKAQALKRFVKWADLQVGLPLSTSSFPQLLAKYSPRYTDDASLLRYLAGQSLKLSEREVELLFPARVEPPPDSWRIDCSTLSGGSRTMDFLRLVFVGDVALDIRKFRDVRPSRLIDAGAGVNARAGLIDALRIEAAVLAGGERWETSIGRFYAICRFVKWADKNKCDLSRESAVDVLKKYSNFQTGKWRAGGCKPGSAYASVNGIVNVLAPALGIQPYELTAQLTLPEMTASGLVSEMPNDDELRDFCSFLHELIRLIAVDVVLRHWDHPIDAQVGKYLIQLPTAPKHFANSGIEPRLQNSYVTRIRIWAELSRFIAVTGCNFTPATSISVGEWINRGDNSIEVFKARANKDVRLHVSRAYARHLDAHVAFMRQAYPCEITEETPLFPEMRLNAAFSREIVASSRAGLLRASLHPLSPPYYKYSSRVLSDQGVQIFTARPLRFAKATWVLRRYKGDALKVSAALGNTPHVVHKHYGGKGNLTQAQLEWSLLWEAPPDLQLALAPGLCKNTGQFEGRQGEQATGCSDGGCLLCANYRGEDSLDYIHRLLSWRFCLSFRAISNESAAISIYKIDEIVISYLSRHPTEVDDVAKLNAEILENPHPRFSAMIALIRKTHGI